MKNSFKTIDPAGKVLAQISTHVAVVENGKIAIYTRGMEDTEDGFKILPERLYSIPMENKDDLFDIMGRYTEGNRCNLAEANGDY